MNFILKNFGKIAEADIKIDGITVVCGNNNTGKSTIGKALFSFFNSLNNYKDKIIDLKIDEIKMFIRNIVPFSNFLQAINFNFNELKKFISSHEEKFSVDEVKSYLETNYELILNKDDVSPLVERLNTSETDIMNEQVYRYFNNVMNGQIKRINSGNNECTVSAEIKGSKYTLIFSDQKCNCKYVDPILHNAYYINSPFALDYLNMSGIYKMAMNIMEKNVIDAIIEAQTAINEDSMTNILESVTNKKDLDIVRDVLKKAYKGNTKISHGKYYYSEDDSDFDLRNISAGLKAFALIERLLETGALKRKDVLILDEPEIHLHSEWQIIYAELIVVLQKKFDLTILIVTHSFQFLESLNFFMKKYEISDRGNYYLPESTNKGFVMKSCGNNPDELKQNLVKGSVRIADMEFEFDMEQDDNDT